MDQDTYRKLNNKIKQAWQILEDESCPSCGVPVWLGHSVLGEIGFEVRRTKCYGCVAKDQAGKIGKDQTGVTDYVIPIMLDGMDLITRERGYQFMEDSVALSANPEDNLPDDERPTEEDVAGI